MLDIALLGTGGMVPLHDRHLTALLTRHEGRMLLIDCGEGTQVSMRRLGWGFINLDYILLTHFHADHTAGLPGLLLSLSNYGRSEPLTIVGPRGVRRVVESLRVIAPELAFPVEYLELAYGKGKQVDFQLGDFHLSALGLEHAMPCFGYSIAIPRAGKFDPHKAKELNIPLNIWARLQAGETVEGFTPDMVLGPARKGIKVSYITDTRPTAAMPSFIQGSDLFICEGMYGSDDMKAKAHRYYHMVFSDAARLAAAGEVRELWLTHYSQAFKNPNEHIEEVRKVFKHSIAGHDRMTKTLNFE